MKIKIPSDKYLVQAKNLSEEEAEVRFTLIGNTLVQGHG